MKIIAMATGGLYGFFDKDGVLFYCKKQEGGKWTKPMVLYEAGLTHFTASLCEGQILILAHTKKQVDCITFKEGKPQISTLVESGLRGHYCGLKYGLETFLIHNMPVLGEYGHILMSHIIKEDGQWTKARHLGRIIPFNKNNAFEVVPISGQHYLLFYQAQGSGFGADLGYREIYKGQLGDFKLIHKNANINGYCHSFLASTTAVHMLYMTRGLLSPTLNYIKKDAQGLSQKIIVAQGHNVHSPLLYMNDNTLNMLYMRGEELLAGTILDAGKPSISPPIKQAIKASEVEKCRFLCDKTPFTNFYANELPLKRALPFELAVIGDLLDFAKMDFAAEKQQAKLGEGSLCCQKAGSLGSQDEYNDFFEGDFCES